MPRWLRVALGLAALGGLGAAPALLTEAPEDVALGTLERDRLELVAEASQPVVELLARCHRLAFLSRGRVAAAGTLAELRDQVRGAVLTLRPRHPRRARAA
ncbi:MAG: hypothetical protein AB7N76_10545 [Planctomycetota bacterium]